MEDGEIAAELGFFLAHAIAALARGMHAAGTLDLGAMQDRARAASIVTHGDHQPASNLLAALATLLEVPFDA